MHEDFLPVLDRAIALAAYCKQDGVRGLDVCRDPKREAFKQRFPGWGITFYVGYGQILVGAYRLDSDEPGGCCAATALHGCQYTCRSARSVDDGVNDIWAQMMQAGH